MKERKQLEPFEVHREIILKFLEKRDIRNSIMEKKLDAMVKAAGGTVTKDQLLAERAAHAETRERCAEALRLAQAGVTLAQQAEAEKRGAIEAAQAVGAFGGATQEEVARWAGVTVRTVTAYAKRGLLRGICAGAQGARRGGYLLSSVRQLMDSGSGAATAADSDGGAAA